MSSDGGKKETTKAEREKRERVLNLKSRNLRTLKYHCTEEIKKPVNHLKIQSKQERCDIGFMDTIMELIFLNKPDEKCNKIEAQMTIQLKKNAWIVFFYFLFKL